MNNTKNQKALVIIPVLNEAGRLAGVIEKIPRQVLNAKIDVLVVDDGSTDKSNAIAKGKGCLLITHKNRLGYGVSVKDGFAYGIKHSYDYVLKLDGDGQHDPFYLGTILKILLRGGVDYVVSSRYMRTVDKVDTPPIDRHVVNSMCTGAINGITKLGLTDVFCGIFGLTNEALSKLDLVTDGYGLELEMILQSYYNGARFLEIPHPLIYTSGSSKFIKTYGKNDKDSLGVRLGVYAEIILDTLDRYNIKEF